MNGPIMKPSAEYAKDVLQVHALSEIDAVEVHGVRAAGAAGGDPMIDDESPESFATYYHKKTGESVRCGDFTEDWAAQEYAAALSDQYNLPVVDYALAAFLGREPVESTEHMTCPPGM